MKSLLSSLKKYEKKDRIVEEWVLDQENAQAHTALFVKTLQAKYNIVEFDHSPYLLVRASYDIYSVFLFWSLHLGQIGIKKYHISDRWSWERNNGEFAWTIVEINEACMLREIITKICINLKLIFYIISLINLIATPRIFHIWWIWKLVWNI